MGDHGSELRDLRRGFLQLQKRGEVCRVVIWMTGWPIRVFLFEVVFRPVFLEFLYVCRDM